MIGIFGANGFIGRAVARHLIGQGRRVLALGRTFPADYGKIVGGSVETRVLDFTDSLSVHATLQEVDQAIDLVNSSSPALGNDRVTEDAATNVLPHISFVQSCILSRVSRIVFLSSGGTVYGSPRYAPIDEDHPTDPLVSYGATKLMVEHYIRMLTRNSGTDHVILRASNVFGPGQSLRKGQGLVASILERRHAGLPITVYGNGAIQRDYLYIDDLCRAVAAALDAPSMRETINIGTGHGQSILDVISTIEKLTKQHLPIQFVEGRMTDAQSNILDCRKAAELLAWKAMTAFEQGLRRTVEAAMNDSR